MYYYRNKRKKSKKGQQQQTAIVPPLNDVWESFQEEKTYLDFGISEEAYRFLSDREKCNRIRENNQYWNKKKAKLKEFGECSFLTWVLAFALGALFRLISNNPPDFVLIVCVILVLFPLITNLVILWPIRLIEKKTTYAYDEFERIYKQYLEYHKQYEIKKNQYITHTKELENFKKNKEELFLNSIAEQLKKIQGRTYRTEDEWRQMSDRDFEFEIGKVYSRLGYQTQVTKRSGDGGVDVIATKDKETIFIQCKHYSAKTHLGAPELQAFWGCCSGNGISKGVMVCTSSLTKDARSFANKLKGKLEIVGMKELLELDKAFFQSHPINSQRQFTDAFRSFISSKNFVDCNHLWLMSKVYYNEEDAKRDMATLTKWKNHTYLLKDTIVKLTNKIRVYVILLVPDYALEETKNTHI